MKPTKVHDFHEQLEWSQRASDEPFWDAIYKKAFPDMVGHMVSTGNTAAQHNGIDRWITLKNGSVLRIDEKKRLTVYPDILLEHISNSKTNAPGWMDKDLSIDYLAYAFMPIKRVHLYPWLMLRRAWLHYRETWLEKYRIVPAKNVGYITYSVAVPIKVLRKAVGTAAIIQLEDNSHEN